MKSQIYAISTLICLVSIQFLFSCSHTRFNEAAPMARVDLMSSFVNVYSGPLNHLRSVRSSACPMHPSCSEYSRKAFEKYGASKGWVMTVDRLIRCGRDEVRFSDRIWVNGQIKYHDPIENNLLKARNP